MNWSFITCVTVMHGLFRSFVTVMNGIFISIVNPCFANEDWDVDAMQSGFPACSMKPMDTCSKHAYKAVCKTRAYRAWVTGLPGHTHRHTYDWAICNLRDSCERVIYSVCYSYA